MRGFAPLLNRRTLLLGQGDSPARRDPIWGGTIRVTVSGMMCGPCSGECNRAVLRAMLSSTFIAFLDWYTAGFTATLFSCHGPLLLIATAALLEYSHYSSQRVASSAILLLLHVIATAGEASSPAVLVASCVVVFQLPQQ